MGECPDLSKTGFLSTDVTMSKIPQSPTASLREIYVASILSATATTKHLFFFFSKSSQQHKNSQNLPFDTPPPSPIPVNFYGLGKTPEQHACYYIQNQTHVHSIPFLPAPYLIPSAFQIPAFKPRISTPRPHHRKELPHQRTSPSSETPPIPPFANSRMSRPLDKSSTSLLIIYIHINYVVHSPPSPPRPPP